MGAGFSVRIGCPVKPENAGMHLAVPGQCRLLLHAARRPGFISPGSMHNVQVVDGS